MPTKGGKFRKTKSRKSRRVRLPISIGWGFDVSFTPQLADWHRIETAYGHPLSAEQREAITLLVENYFRWQPGEARAPFADDARRYLAQLEKVGNQFWRVLLERSHIPMSGTGPHDQHIAEQDMIRGVAIGYVQDHFGRYVAQFDHAGKTNFKRLLNVMQACIPAFEATKRYLDEQVKLGFVEGRAWNELAWKLTEFANENGLASRVTKYDDPKRASPFVAFFRELQRTFPPEFQRHQGSNAALAEAINVACRDIRRALADREAKKNKSKGAGT
jgi:hypothetical protein